MRGTRRYLTFIHTAQYLSAAKGVVEDSLQRDIEEAICANPDGTPVEAGVRKIRVARPGTGKSGGVRVIYYYIARRGRVYLIDVFAKNVRDALTKAEKNAVRALARHFEEEP
jgi:hypothetical protein